ncbi:DUF3879 family protein [Streptococcus equinus]|uniref:DUF3879 family protein n=1 Tax=Streptococcus equinus TaxID=1335 RepID=UPI0012F906A5|nr:DUF3879 family protein [Streptococcus equinus]
MQIINDYSYLFQNMSSGMSNNRVNDIKVSQIGSKSVQSRLQAAGINTNSAQYKAAIKAMTSHPGRFWNVYECSSYQESYEYL